MDTSLWDHFDKALWAQTTEAGFPMIDNVYPILRQTLADGETEWPSSTDISLMSDPYMILFSLILLMKSIHETPRIIRVRTKIYQKTSRLFLKIYIQGTAIMAKIQIVAAGWTAFHENLLRKVEDLQTDYFRYDYSKIC